MTKDQLEIRRLRNENLRLRKLLADLTGQVKPKSRDRATEKIERVMAVMQGTTQTMALSRRDVLARCPGMNDVEVSNTLANLEARGRLATVPRVRPQRFYAKPEE